MTAPVLIEPKKTKNEERKNRKRFNSPGDEWQRAIERRNYFHNSEAYACLFAESEGFLSADFNVQSKASYFSK